MKPVLPLVVLAAVAAFSLPGNSQSGVSNDPLRFYLTESRIFDPVDNLTWCGDCVFIRYQDSSPWVVNPGTYWPFDMVLPATPTSSSAGCNWDSDDFYTYASEGNVLAVGAAVSVERCWYGARSSHVEQPMDTDILIRSSSPDLSVTETWRWDNDQVTTQVAATFDRATHTWLYFDCIESPFPVNGTVVEVPGSNGGMAVPVRVTVTVANPTRWKAVKTGGVIEAGILPAISRGCTAHGWRQP